MNRRVTILYSELAEYSMACFRALSATGTKIQLVHWPVNPEAPFQFDLSFLEESIDRKSIEIDQLKARVDSFAPELILCSGWMDKGYLTICKAHKSRSKTVLSLDNHWTGSIKQQLARLAAPFTLKQTFSDAFVPGKTQKEYAQKLGFPEEHIEQGFYCADVQRFSSYYKALNEVREEVYPKRFLYLGRYVEHKGIFDLWNAFTKLHAVDPSWELWCAGTGDQWGNRMHAEGITHLGFLQPDLLLPVLKACSWYVLPSHFEPWGVSVQEMAVAGFPLLLSEEIGAKEHFLRDNGRHFEAGNVEALFNALVWASNQTEEAYKQLSRRSHELGTSHTPKAWAAKLLDFFQR